MPAITLRGLTDDLHEALRAAADDAHRSLNSELLHRLESSVHSPGERRPGDRPPRPPRFHGEVREPSPDSSWNWGANEGRTIVDVTVTPVVAVLHGVSIQEGRQSALLVASAPDDGWLRIEWHWIRADEEEAVPPGAARIAIGSLRDALPGGGSFFDRDAVVDLATDFALAAMGEARAAQSPLARVTRFVEAPAAALLRLRIDPEMKGQLEKVRETTGIAALRGFVDRLLAVEVEFTRPDGRPGEGA